MRALFLGSVVLVACADTGRFSTDKDKDESWCGTVTSPSFVRAGIEPGTKLRLLLDADALQTSPGRIWTSPLATGERFTATKLEVIPQLMHDPLSTLTFGEGRLKNALAVADLGGSQVIVVVSLMQSNEVEVRLLRGATTGDAGAPPLLFGVFRLTREQGNCGLP